MDLKKIAMLVTVFLVAIGFGIFLFLTGTDQNTADTHKGTIIVASKIDTEGSLLGNIILLVLEEDGFQIINKIQLGPTDVVRKAIFAGEIDIYPEYTGNGNFFFSNTDQETWKNPQKAYELVKKLDSEQNKIVWLKPAPANNTWAVAIQKTIADEFNLETMTDLGRYIADGNPFKIACSEEFVSRPDALPSFEEAYNFNLTKDQMLILSGGNTTLTEKAAAEGTDGVNTAMAYGTDGQIAALGLKVLTDNKGVQPVYEPAPIIRKTIYDQYPEIEKLLEPVFASLTLEVLQDLNSRIAVEGQPPRQVASDYLKTLR